MIFYCNAHLSSQGNQRKHPTFEKDDPNSKVSGRLREGEGKQGYLYEMHLREKF